MNFLRKCFSILMTAAFAVGMAGCSAGARVPNDFDKAAKSYGIKEVEDIFDLPKRTTVANNSEGSGYYIAKDVDDAARIRVISHQ